MSKVLSLVQIYLVVLTWLTSSNCHNQFFLIDNLKGVTYCVTNSTDALSWIDENTDDNQMSRYIPNHDKNFVNWSISIEENKPFHFDQPWILKKSLNNEIVLDRRWEEMKVFVTNPSIPKHNFITAASHLPQNFLIPFSIRIESGAHLFLCENDDLTNASCYWFQLRHMSNKKTSVVKCFDVNLLSSIVNELLPHQHYNCSKNLNEKRGIIDEYLYGMKWSHFELRKNERQIILTNLSDKRKIITFHDSALRVKHLIIHSNDVVGLWKLHQLEYLYTDKEVENVKIGPGLPVVDGTICLSIWVLMCPHCKIKLTLSDPNNTNQKVLERTHGPQLEGKWSEIKVIQYNVLQEEVILSVSTIGSNSGKKFWAIDSLRQCLQDEFRIIKSEKAKLCQMISLNSDDIIATQRVINAEGNDRTFCIPCRWLSEDCGQARVIKKYKGNSICSCSSGIKNADCSAVCDKNYFGHNCPKDTVKQTFATLVSYRVGSTEATIKISSSKNFNEKADYIVEYKEQTDKKWKQIDGSYPLGQEVTVNITKLKAKTKYNVRTVILTGDNGNKERWTTIITKCLEISKESVSLEVSNSTANISLLKSVHKDICRFTECEVHLKAKEAKIRVSQQYIFVNNLTPFREYNVSIRCDSQETLIRFRTTEGIPEKISKLNFVDISPDSLCLEWDVPKRINGVFSHYTVEYQLLGHKACKTSLGVVAQSKNMTKESKIKFTRLNPYSIYSFSVSTNNTSFQSTPLTKRYETPASEDIYEEEIPRIEISRVNASSVQVEFSQIDCNKHRGLLWREVTLSCSHQWCIPKTEKIQNNTLTHTWSNLFPYSNYTLQVKFSRSTKFENSVTQKQKFQTNFSVANEVRELLVYSKSESSISLKWREPYPPTGVLALYNIRYHSKSSSGTAINVTDSPCKLWPTYQCVTISDLKRNQTYEIEVRGLNRGIQNFGKIRRIEARTIIEPSTPPYDLRYNWTPTNDLELRWKHPNETNGDIMLFYVTLLPTVPNVTPYFGKVSVSKLNYMLDYHHRIEKKDLSPTTKYRIKISAENGVAGRELIVQIDTPSWGAPGSVLNLELIVVISLIVVGSVFAISLTGWLTCRMIKKRNVPEDSNFFEEIALRSIIDNEYVNVSKYTKAIQLSEFRKYVSDFLHTGSLVKEYQSIINNVDKNIYETTRGDFLWEDIEIHFKKGTKTKVYIAAELPDSRYFDDFFKLIWDENIQHTILLDNADQYELAQNFWPSSAYQAEEDAVSIELISEKVFVDFSCRKYALTYQRQTREIDQLYFSSWLEPDIPYLSSAAAFFREMLKFPLRSESPILVHCSSGIEVVGFALLCDMCLRQARDEEVDISRTLQNLAVYPAGVVGNIRHYLLAHLVVLENTVVGGTGVKCDNFDLNLPILISNEEIQKHLEHLQEMLWLDQQAKMIKAEVLHEEMLAENPPLEEHQYTYVDTLNTVWVDRFTKSHQFVIAPHPSQHSLAYFWQFMEELNITVIISLNEPQWCRQKCRIWPDKHHPQMNPSKSTSVKHDSTTKLKNYSWIKVVLTGVKKQTPIEILSLKNWPTASNCPEDIADFVNFCIETKDVLKGSNPVLVTCHDGLTASGLYVAMLYNIGRMKMEEVCDVCSSVRKIKSFRQDFLKREEQFIFLWEAAENYLKEIQMYETV